MTATVSNIPLEDVPSIFIENLDHAVGDPVDIDWEALKPEDYKWVGRRGKSKPFDDAFASIIWVDEPEGYRIATFGVCNYELDAIRDCVNQQVTAIEKQREARAEILRELEIEDGA